MTKRQLIDEIMHINRSARPEFLAHFDDADLGDYLEHMRKAMAPRVSIPKSRLEQYFNNVPAVANAATSTVRTTLADIVNKPWSGGVEMQFGSSTTALLLGDGSDTREFQVMDLSVGDSEAEANYEDINNRSGPFTLNTNSVTVEEEIARSQERFLDAPVADQDLVQVDEEPVQPVDIAAQPELFISPEAVVQAAKPLATAEAPRQEDSDLSADQERQADGVHETFLF